MSPVMATRSFKILSNGGDLSRCFGCARGRLCRRGIHRASIQGGDWRRSAVMAMAAPETGNASPGSSHIFLFAGRRTRRANPTTTVLLMPLMMHNITRCVGCCCWGCLLCWWLCALAGRGRKLGQRFSFLLSRWMFHRDFFLARGVENLLTV